MVVICEGIDNVGKGTQIQNIKDEFERQGKSVHILHYSNIKAFEKSETDKIRTASYKQFRDMFKIVNYAAGEDSFVLILDRAHLGECVYSPIYRNYSGEFVFEEEKTFIWEDNFKNIKMILFTDEAENVIKRDDGLSFSTELETKKKEIELFDKAFEKSKLNKKRISLNGRDKNQIWNEEVKPYIFG